MKSNKLSSFTTSNGLTIIHIPRPNSLSVSISLMVIAGCIYESPKEIGVAHFLEHIVFNGTKKYPNGKQLAELVDNRGGIRNAITGKETIEYFIKILKDDIEIAFEYLSQISIYPLIKEEDIIKQKSIIEQEINRFKSDPEKLSQRLIYSLVFPNTRMGIFTTGDIDNIKSISREGIISYHKKTHCAKNMVLSISGDVSEEQIKTLAEKYFGNLDSGQKISNIDIQVSPKTELTSIVQNDLKQTTLILGYKGFKSTDNRHYVLDILSVLLTKGKSSRLFDEIREKRALAYAVSSNNFSARNTGIFTLSIGLSGNKVSECLDIIKSEFNRLLSEDITTEELNKILTFIKSTTVFSFENSLTEASYYSRMWCFNGYVKSIEQELIDYESVIKDNNLIKNTIKDIFSSNPSILTIGPQSD